VYADELLVPWHEALRAEQPPVGVFDCHTHVGVNEGRLRPVHELARSAVARAWPFARERGCEEALALVEALLIRGNGTEHQRRAHAVDGMPGVVAHLVESSRTHM
jgi:gamma-glutamyl:cysteine ligase YbdK (ATP-grasp superfamily)